jgi:hypothetical protein
MEQEVTLVIPQEMSIGLYPEADKFKPNLQVLIL